MIYNALFLTRRERLVGDVRRQTHSVTCQTQFYCNVIYDDKRRIGKVSYFKVHLDDVENKL